MSSVETDQNKSYSVNAAAHIKGMKNEDVVKYYSSWSENYEKDLNPNFYRGPEIAADICNIFIVNKESKLVDIGSGTGFVGDYLNLRGFKNVDALEPSDGMVEVSKRKGVYKNYFVEPINADKPTSLGENSYDALVLAGSMGEGHIPTNGLREFARVTKPGGLIFIVMREEYLSIVDEYKDRLEPLMKQMESEGVWKIEQRIQVPHYSFNKTGLIFILKKN